MSAEDLFFDEQVRESLPLYWSRMGGRPDVSGLKVVDFGCGHGAMSVELAQAGASVCGVDLDAGRIEYARNRSSREGTEVASRLRFEAIDIAQVSESGQFDAIFTKDTFEHVADLNGVLTEFRRLLRPGGTVYAGFSPLYHSPFGDHGRAGYRMPWAHTVLPSRRVFANASRHNGYSVTCLEDLGLNGLTAPEYFDRFCAAGFETAELRVNVGTNRALPAFNLIRRLSALEKFFTVSVYGPMRCAS